MEKIGRYSVLLAVFCLYLGMVTSCATIPEDTSGRVEIEKEDTRVVMVFNEEDSRLIRQYYRTHLKALPPGLAKKRRLPPGLERQIVRNGKLPPGLSEKPIPASLERELSPLPDGYIRIRVGADVVLLDERTRVVMDVLYDVTE
ncbi:MAG: hypothetical protein GTN70_02585 [Deltaproteobacteria bacterium]|nr:hypothetical protein [Deltaproteobacteria bacterium]NIS76532.1 hypothetical protein [Deltaproteobacteria bacterium]